MIVRLFGRFADARLRAQYARAVRHRRRLVGLLRQARSETRAVKRQVKAREQSINTLQTLLATWEGIARQAQNELAALRQQKETTP